MNRIADTFKRLKKQGRKGLVGYMTAGDPDIATSERNIRQALEAGVDILELGVPFSDPTADGPTIQVAAQRALASGMNLREALAMVARLRADFNVPIVLFGYANPFFHYGYELFCADAAEAGADAMLVVDMPCEEADELRQFMTKQELSFIPLVAPTTSRERAATVLAKAEGFVYYIMVTGVTGARATLAKDVAKHVDLMREFTDLPVAVGFGVSNGEQAREAGAAADAVVVGSALVKAAYEGRAGDFVRELRQGLDGS